MVVWAMALDEAHLMTLFQKVFSTRTLVKIICSLGARYENGEFPLWLQLGNRVGG